MWNCRRRYIWMNKQAKCFTTWTNRCFTPLAILCTVTEIWLVFQASYFPAVPGGYNLQWCVPGERQEWSWESKLVSSPSFRLSKLLLAYCKIHWQALGVFEFITGCIKFSWDANDILYIFFILYFLTNRWWLVLQLDPTDKKRVYNMKYRINGNCSVKVSWWKQWSGGFWRALHLTLVKSLENLPKFRF